MATKASHLRAVDPEAPHYTLWDGDEEAQRPWRLWNATEKRDVPYRYYAIKRNALDKALLETAWATKVGTSIEVYDCRTARHIATYTLHANGEISRWMTKDARTEERVEQ